MTAIFNPGRMTQNEKKEIVGSISALDESRNEKTIIVCQILSTHYQGHLHYSKEFYLDSIDGPRVYPTDDPAVYQLLDGTTLKRRGRCAVQE